MERQEEVRSERIELLDGCGLLSVNDAMVRRAVVPAGLFLLIFPCSLCWLMVRIGSEAEKRCGLNLVTLRPVLSPCCVLPLCLPFCLIPFCSLVHIFSSLILSASICLLCPHFLPWLSSVHLILRLSVPLQERVYDKGESLMNTLKSVRKLAWAIGKQFLFEADH